VSELPPASPLGVLFEASSDACVVTDARGIIQHINPACTRILGYQARDLVGRPIEVIVPPRFGDHAERRGSYQAAPVPRGMGRPLELAALHAEGHEVHVDIALTPLQIGPERYVCASIRDMRQRNAALEPLRLQATALRSAASGILLVDRDGTIRWANPAVCAITGYEEAELLGRHTRLFKSGAHGDEVYRSLWETITQGKAWSGTLINRRKDGTTYHEEQTIAPVVDDTGVITHYIAIKQDVSERFAAAAALERAQAELATRMREVEALNAQLHDQANRDPLTHLYNRRFYQETVDRELNAGARLNKVFSVAVLDLDRFKEINDTHGHPAGDRVLIALADVLRSRVRASDLVCRVGGEEFVWVLPGASVEMAAERAETLRAAFEGLTIQAPGGGVVRASVSIGIAARNSPQEALADVVRRADAALYAAKRGGRNRVERAEAASSGWLR